MAYKPAAETAAPHNCLVPGATRESVCDKCLNVALARNDLCYTFSLREIAVCIRLAASKMVKPVVVSVGSGMGEHEALLKLAVPELEFICVDNAPGSCSQTRTGLSMDPAHATDADLIKSRPDIVGNCILLLFWTYPRNFAGDYDERAIHNLKPGSIISIYEAGGTAGGELFHQRLQRMGVSKNAFNKADREIVNNEATLEEWRGRMAEEEKMRGRYKVGRISGHVAQYTDTRSGELILLNHILLWLHMQSCD
jgi:hypothetical protein